MVGKKPSTLSPAEQQAEAYATRLKKLHEGTVVAGTARESRAEGTPGAVPHALRRCDGADVVKKNAARKKKYLFSFPGSLNLPPGGRVGSLSGLDTSTPVLDMHYGEGRLRLRGSLVFPRNAILTLKGSTGRDKPVRVTDTFETLVVFSEWVWLGREADNPGDVAKPLPASLRGHADAKLWRETGNGDAAKRGRTSAAAAVESAGVDYSMDSDDEPLIAVGGGDVEDVSGDDDIGFGAVSITAPERSNPRRAKRPKRLLDGFDDSDDGDDDDDDDSVDDDDDDVDDVVEDLAEGKEENPTQPGMASNGVAENTATRDASDDDILLIDVDEDVGEDAVEPRRPMRPRRASTIARPPQEKEESGDSDGSASSHSDVVLSDESVVPSAASDDDDDFTVT